MSFADLKRDEQAEAERLTTTARQVGAGALSGTVIAAARTALQAVVKGKGDTIGEPAAELRQIRTAPALLAVLGREKVVATHTALMLLLDALALGYKAEAEGQAKLLGSGARAVVTLTEDDRRDLVDYPITGGSNPPRAFTAAEIADDLTYRLRHEVDGALAAPLVGQVNPQAIVANLGAISQAHADRLATAVSEAYFAGVQAGLRAFGAALVGQS